MDSVPEAVRLMSSQETKVFGILLKTPSTPWKNGDTIEIINNKNSNIIYSTHNLNRLAKY
jgi:hypothetical protein